jgi:hypothetical protein
MSIARLCKVIAGASDNEVERVRQDCRRLDALARSAETVNWGIVDATLSRRTRRMLKARRFSPPAAVTYLLDRWGNFDFRAVLLPFLISVRRSPEHSKNLSQLLTIAESAIAAFPKISDNEGSSVVPTEVPP